MKTLTEYIPTNSAHYPDPAYGITFLRKPRIAYMASPGMAVNTLFYPEITHAID